jgi:hypothetical protein
MIKYSIWTFLLTAVAGQGTSVFAGGDDAIQEALDPANQIGDDYHSVMAGLTDYSEEANLRRYRLQLLLIDREPKLRAALQAMFAKLAAMYTDMQNVRNAVAKQTTVIDADASAGGLYAASRELIAEVPETQKLMNKVFGDLYKSLVKDGKAINESLSTVEDDYRARIDASGKIITALLAKLDKDYASKAYSQELAMRQAVSNLQDKSLASLKQQEQQTNKTRDLISKVSQSISDSTAQVADIISQFSLMPAQIQNLHKQQVAALQTDFQKTLSDAEATAEKTIQKNVDDSLAGMQTQGMRIAQQFQRDVTATQSRITQKLSDVQDMVNRETTNIRRGINVTVAQISGQVDQIQANATRNINQIGKRSDILTGDAIKTASDSRDLLTELSNKLGMSRQDFIAALGQVKAGLPKKLQSVLQKMLSVNQGMNADIIQELLRENGGIAYIGQFTDDQLAKLGIALDSKISKTQTGIANQGFTAKSIIDRLMGSIDQNNRQTATDTTLAVGKSQQSLQAILSSMGGSIDDLMALLGDTNSNSQAAMAQIKQSLLAMNSDSLMSVLARLKQLSSDNSDQMENFVKLVVGPDNHLTESQFQQIASMLTTLLALEQSIEEEQNHVMQSLQKGQAATAANISDISDRIQSATSSALGLAHQIGATSEGRLAALKALLSSKSMKASQEAQESASTSLNTIDSMFAHLDAIARGIHQSVSQSIANTGSDLDQAGRQLTSLGQNSAEAVNALSAQALSIVNSAEKQQGLDFSTAKASIEKLRKDFISTFKQQAVVTTDAALAEVRARLQNATQQESAVKEFVASIEDGLKRIKSDIQITGKYSDSQSAVLKSRISQAEQRLAQINVEIKSGMATTIDAFQKKLADKEAYLNATGEDLNSQLAHVKDLVKKAQNQLRKNLQMYQTKINSIISEIRGYMNLSSTADELAISHDIANQLAAVNATSIQLANIRSGIQESLGNMKQRFNDTANRSTRTMAHLMQSAASVSQSASDSRIANLKRLTAVGLSVDNQANSLRTSLLKATKDMQSQIIVEKNATAARISQVESDQATRLARIQRDASNVETQARKRFIDNLNKIGGLNDELGLTTKQLAQLLDNANATIDDISTSVMSHMDLGYQTLYNLNKAENRKIASVQDVLSAFSSVVLMFLNETELSMNRAMNDMNLLDSSSKKKLGVIQSRSNDEANWLGNNLNATVEKFTLSLEQERAVQEGLKHALENSKRKLIAVRQREDDDIASITGQIGALETKIRQGGQSQIAKVRRWIANRSPQIAKKYVGHDPGSLMELIQLKHRNRRRHRKSTHSSPQTG